MLREVTDAMYASDLVIYDVSGDIVCGGFTIPIRKGLVDEAYILTSGEYMPLYAANNVCKGLNKLGALLGGVICISRETSNEEAITRWFAEGLGSKLVAFIPKGKIVQDCEHVGLSIIEGCPCSRIAEIYRELASDMMGN